MTAWDDWLRKLSADGKGGLGLRGQPQMRAIDRGLAYAYVMAVGMDVSADRFEASIRAAPDAAGATPADFDVTVGAYDEDRKNGAEGKRVEVRVDTGGCRNNTK